MKPNLTKANIIYLRSSYCSFIYILEINWEWPDSFIEQYSVNLRKDQKVNVVM